MGPCCPSPLEVEVSTTVLVTETGGLLSHAAIVAREISLPAVVAAPDATQALRDGTTVRVDGDRGSVTRLRSAGR